MKILERITRWHIRKILPLLPKSSRWYGDREMELRLKELQIIGFVLWVGLGAVLVDVAMS
jgi:hypothetical protein